jgi:hypothetical protein
VAISHIYKDACRLAQAKGLARQIYHEPALEVRFVRKAMGTTSFLTIRADRGAKPALARMGRVLQTRPCPITLQPTRSLDSASYLVASLQALAQRRLETTAPEDALPRLRACQPSWINSLNCVSAAVSLRESCIREMRTCSLRGGRRLARKRAFSDPTPVKVENRRASERSGHGIHWREGGNKVTYLLKET